MRTNLRIAFLFLSLLVTVACQPGRLSDSEQGPYKVKIADYSPDQGYHLKVVELSTLKSISQAKGSAAEFIIQPRYRNGQIRGLPMNLQTIKSSDGVYIAKNSDSLQALTLYTHFERLKKLDQKLGLAKLNPGPRKVIVQALFQRGASTEPNNAFYSSDLDAILFSKFTSESLPLMANGGVVAHEHFHSLFQKIMNEGTPLPLSMSPHLEEEDLEVDSSLSARQQYDLVLLRAFNEGLADIWGWAYSGDLDFVGRSVPRYKAERSLGKDLIEFSSGEVIRGEMDRLSKDSYNLLSYRLGTEIARFARAALDEAFGKSATAEQKLKAVSEFIPKLKKFVTTIAPDQYWEPADAMTLFVKGLQFSNESSCAHLSEKISHEARRVFFNLCRKPK